MYRKRRKFYFILLEKNYRNATVYQHKVCNGCITQGFDPHRRRLNTSLKIKLHLYAKSCTPQGNLPIQITLYIPFMYHRSLCQLCPRVTSSQYGNCLCSRTTNPRRNLVHFSQKYYRPTGSHGIPYR